MGVQLEAAAEVAVQLCILAGRAAALWEHVFPRFQAYDQAAVLLGRLQPHILAGDLPSPAPEVVQVPAPAPLLHCHPHKLPCVARRRRTCSQAAGAKPMLSRRCIPVADETYDGCEAQSMWGGGQALVVHLAEAGQAEQVERCVVHMDIASLDITQARPLRPSPTPLRLPRAAKRHFLT